MLSLIIQAWQTRVSGSVTTPDGHTLSFETGLLKAYEWRGVALDPIAAIVPDAKDERFAALVDGYLARLGDSTLRVAASAPIRAIRAALEPAELAVWDRMERRAHSVAELLSCDLHRRSVRALVFALGLAGRLERVASCRSGVTPRVRPMAPCDPHATPALLPPEHLAPEQRALRAYLAAEERGRPPPLSGHGHYRAEIDALSRVIDEAPFSAPAYCYRARLYKRLGRLREALDDLKRAAKLDPGNGDAARELREWEKRKSGPMSAVRPACKSVWQSG